MPYPELQLCWHRGQEAGHLLCPLVPAKVVVVAGVYCCQASVQAKAEEVVVEDATIEGGPERFVLQRRSPWVKEA